MHSAVASATAVPDRCAASTNNLQVCRAANGRGTRGRGYVCYWQDMDSREEGREQDSNPVITLLHSFTPSLPPTFRSSAERGLCQTVCDTGPLCARVTMEWGAQRRASSMAVLAPPFDLPPAPPNPHHPVVQVSGAHRAAAALTTASAANPLIRWPELASGGNLGEAEGGGRAGGKGGRGQRANL